MLIPRLKRTTDVMFGGKQVIVCGYGEVRSIHNTVINLYLYLTIPYVYCCKIMNIDIIVF